MDKQIRLNRDHIPLNPKLNIRTQKEYDFHIETLRYLNKQIQNGFQPKYLVSFHYRHPSERYTAKKETKNLLGWKDRYGMNNRNSLWGEIPQYNYYDKRRNDYDLIVEDTNQIRRVIARHLYGINKINHLDKYPTMFFFHELGKSKLSYHSHLLLPKQNERNELYQLKINDLERLTDEFNITIKYKRKCFSSWKSIHIREVDDPYKAVSYLNKETSQDHYSLDYTNSIFTHEK